MGARGHFFRMCHGMSRNPKILAAGGDAAWLWSCSIDYAAEYRTNGVIRQSGVPALSDRRSPMKLAAVLVREQLWHEPGHDCDRCPQPLPGCYIIHDYLEIQGAAENDTAARAAKGAGGSYGNHQRWHASRGITDPDCSHCIAPSDRIASDERSHMRSDTDQSSDRSTDQVSDPDANRICDSVPDGGFRDPGLFPKEIPPPIVPPAEGSDRSSDHARPKARTRRQAYDYSGDLDFLRFWAAFPQPTGKPAAYKAWLAALARGADVEHIIVAAKAYADDPRRDVQHTKYPQGWLNDERYNDIAASGGDVGDDDFWGR